MDRIGWRGNRLLGWFLKITDGWMDSCMYDKMKNEDDASFLNEMDE